jgi:non-ribosomal peptide synthetase component E (peptide arylation enzyme)
MESLFVDQKVEKYKALGGPWSDQVLYDFVKENARRFPDKEAIMDTWTDLPRRFTYRELMRRVDACCLSFLELGLEKEDVVAIQLPNCLEQCIARIALSKIGAIAFPYSESLAEYDVSYLLEVTSPKFAIIPGEFNKKNYLEMYRENRQNISTLQEIFVVGAGVPSGFRPFAELVDLEKLNKYPTNHLDRFKPGVTEIWEMIATSGTTGRPKISLQVPLQFLIAVGQSIIKRTKFTPDDVIVSVTSMAAGLSGVMWGFEMAMLAGAKVCLMPVFSPELALKLIEQERATAVGGVPAIMPRIFSHPDYKKYDTSHLRLATTAGGPFAIELAKKILKSNIIATNMYGASEASAPVTTSIDDIEATLEGKSGKVIPGFELKIVDNYGKEVPQGQEGEITWWSPAAGWFSPREANKENWDDAGYFYSGDIGFVDEKGFLKVSGRKKDMILRGAQNISPKEIEDLLYQHPGILDVAVVKMPDRNLGEKACACVVPKEGQSLTFDEMIKFLTERKLTRYKFPERLEIVEKLPLSPGGKIRKKTLEEYVEQKLKEEGKL